MTLGTLLGTRPISPYDRLVIKNVNADFKLIDIYDGKYHEWTDISSYLERKAEIISVVSGSNNTYTFRIHLYS